MLETTCPCCGGETLKYELAGNHIREELVPTCTRCNWDPSQGNRSETCEFCGEWNGGDLNITGDGDRVCDACEKEHYKECHFCHDRFHESHVDTWAPTYPEVGDLYVCRGKECQEDYAEVLV